MTAAIDILRAVESGSALVADPPRHAIEVRHERTRCLVGWLVTDVPPHLCTWLQLTLPPGIPEDTLTHMTIGLPVIKHPTGRAVFVGKSAILHGIPEFVIA
jgi:hypothetical protein